MRALALAVALVALPAQAELLELDLLAPGDGLVTRDTETGLDWLDLDGVTTGLSYEAIQGGAGGWIASGWRYATEAEVCHLLVEHTQANTCDAIVPFGFVAPTVPLLSFLETTGSGWQGPDDFKSYMLGLYDDGTTGSAGIAGVVWTAHFSFSGVVYLLETSATPDTAQPSDAAPIVGSFLVRATPPAVPALPPAGVVALAAALLLLGAHRQRS